MNPIASPKRFIKVGLTGGIATGKSTVAGLWRAKGAGVIDSDELAHRTLEPGTDSYTEIVQTFGTEILNPDRSINRTTLGNIVFTHEDKRRQLNLIVHPRVRQMWTQQMEQLQVDSQTEVAVASIPLLYEVGANNEFDCIVTVGCSETTQLARLMAKGLTETQAVARMRAQWPLASKMDRADFVIWNDGAHAVLEQQADMIWMRIKELPHAS